MTFADVTIVILIYLHVELRRWLLSLMMLARSVPTLHPSHLFSYLPSIYIPFGCRFSLNTLFPSSTMSFFRQVEQLSGCCVGNDTLILAHGRDRGFSKEVQAVLCFLVRNRFRLELLDPLFSVEEIFFWTLRCDPAVLSFDLSSLGST